MTSNPYLSGNFAPVEDELSATDLPVTGRIPGELEGRLLRIGPNPVAPDPERHHWFLGNGMVHGVRLRGGRAEWYRSRFVRDDELVERMHWPPVAGPKGERRIGNGAANTNVIGHAGRTFAIVEAGSLPVELDEELETLARCDFDGTLHGGFSAHPKRDPDTGELHATAYSPFSEEIQYVVVGADARVRKTVNVPIPDRPMIHDCAITKNWFVILDLPVILDGSVIEDGYQFPYRWHPERGARVGLLPREGGAGDIVWCEVEPCYVFHPMNAYEDAEGRVVLDVVRHPKMFATDFLGPNEGDPTLDRWLVDPKGGPVKEQRIDDRGQEFPRHDERLIGKPYRYGYTAGLASGFAFDGLLKYDMRDDKLEIHHEGPGKMFMEPVFISRTDDADEDDGCVMAYTWNAATNLSSVVILHAQDFAGDPIARIELPRRVPFGFHGNWLPDTE
ncbi:MAG: carotenoid oxygenase family protein [Deltaproteobacteria bacterium]|jgi:carotenoid cleavage dioxygenase|nr:carotenoid oxygenase family protein [Deltaproteobacteria bacterium]